MLINGRNYKTVWFEDNAICTIDQRLLPHVFKIQKLSTVEQVASAIKDMVIRGAPAIGAIAAYGIALSALSFKGNNIKALYKQLEEDASLLRSTRPTAYDLFYGVNAVLNQITSQTELSKAKDAAILAADDYINNSIDACKKIGLYGD